MRKCLPLFLLFALGCAMNAYAQTLVWSDEFNQPKLDVDKWTREVGGSGFGNGELQYYTSGESNVFIGSKTNASDTGYLVIEARRENYGVPPENRQFTSGRIVTSGKFNFKYGTIEARIKLPNLQNGLWPAFWMLGANYPTDGWPKSGEIDILEAGFKDDWQGNVANKKSHSTVHWFQDNYQQIDPNAPGNGWWGNASATNSTTISGNFYDAFHLFKLVWTPTQILGYVDNVQFYTFNIPPSDPNITEFTTNPFYIILNLAVGGSNFVGITDPAQITAPMPAQMLVDYVRVYSNASTEIFQAKNLPKQTGTFGVFTETKPVTASLGATPEIEVWNNLSAASSAPQEGSNVLAFTANPGNWFGLGIPTGATNVKNMQNFIDGQLHFHMKTTSNWPFSVGIQSTMNGNAQGGTQSKTVRLDPANATQYGLVRDGQWHEVVISLSAFGNVEFRSINNMFYIVGDNPSSPVTFAIDNIYWQDGTKVTPQNGDYVLYSDTKTGVDKFDQGIDGDFFVWENTLNSQTTPANEGSNVLSFTNAGKGWFGAAFTPNNVYNLTGFRNTNAKLVFSLKTSDTTTPFYIGMKSGTRDGEGQKWIAFEPGQSPYGFVRNGTWQVVQIPMSDIYDAVDLMEVTQLFQILGTGNIANIAIDNIYFSGAGAAQPDGNTNTPPTANAGADKAITLPANSVVITGSGTDAGGSITAYQWLQVSGPSTAVLTGANTANLTASSLVAGTYVFRLTVTDNGGLTASDDVSVVVSNSTSPNLAFTKPVTVSSTEEPGTPASGAVDGNAATRWSSAHADPQWIYVDLGATYNVNRVKITWEAAYGKDYLVQVSSNTSTWNTIRTVTGNTSLINDHTGLSGSGRYIRIYGTARGTAWGYSIYELEVYGTSAANVGPVANAGADKNITLPTNSVVINGSATDSDGTIASYAWTRVSGPNTPTLSGANTANLTVNGLVAGTYVFRLTVTDNGGLTASDDVTVVVNNAPNVNLALTKPVTVSTTEEPGTPGSAAVDGNAATRWSSAFADPQWIYVDLGATYAVNRVKITWEDAYGKDYRVEISSNASSWSVLKTVTNNTTLVNDHTGLSATGRYVRIYGTARGTVYGYSIYELEVYGSSASGARIASQSLQSDEEATSNQISSVEFYPNPASDFIHIDGLEDGAPVRITPYNGNQIYDFTIVNEVIDIRHIPTGLYIINFNKGSKSIRKTVIKN